jgi:hypothetical protein
MAAAEEAIRQGMTRTVDPGEKRTAETVLRAILPGARLEAVTFRDSLLTLGFFNAAAEGATDRPAYVWLGTISDAQVVAEGAASAAAAADIEALRQSRMRFLPAIYSLLGDEVASAAIGGDGSLALQMSRDTILLLPMAEEPDEIWSVTSDTPEALGEHRWRVTLSDSGRLVIKQPMR